MAVRKPKPGGIETWHQLYGPRGAPRPGERGFVAEPCPGVEQEAERLAERAVQLLKDPEVGPWIPSLWAVSGIEAAQDMAPAMVDEEAWELAPIDPSEFPDLLGAPWMTPYEAADVLWAVNAYLTGHLTEWVLRGVLADGLCVARLEALPERRLRLVLVSPHEAATFIAYHHSKLPEWNYRGLLYTIGIKQGYRLVAVATANTPSGSWKGRGRCDVDGIIELSRIASDGSVLGASSKLAARLLDLLPESGRRGVQGCLFVTYSLVDEAGTTYLALVDKGLRPTRRLRGKQPVGARKKSGYGALPQEDKIVWEAGPAAAPPDWSVLDGIARPERIAGAIRAFEAFERRQRAPR